MEQRKQLAETRKVIERDAHELRARLYGIRARLIAAMTGLDEIGAMLSAMAHWRTGNGVAPRTDRRERFP